MNIRKYLAVAASIVAMLSLAVGCAEEAEEPVEETTTTGEPEPVAGEGGRIGNEER